MNGTDFDGARECRSQWKSPKMRASSKAKKVNGLDLNKSWKKATRHKQGALFKEAPFTTISVIRAFMFVFFLSGVLGEFLTAQALQLEHWNRR